MKNSIQTQKGQAGALVIFIIVVIVAIAAYFIITSSNNSAVSTGEQATSTGMSTSTASTTVTIMVPADIAAYKSAVADHVQVGTADPLPTTQFVATTTAPNTITSDPIRNAAEAAAEVIPTQAGTSSLVRYLKVVNGTAYVLLSMDINGWAGVSVAQAEVHPIVEKTLLTQPGIKAVKFGPAPGDTIESIQSTADWKMYKDVAYGFQLQYPSSWQLTQSVHQSTYSIQDPSGFIVGLSIFPPEVVSNSASASVADFLKAFDAARIGDSMNKQVMTEEVANENAQSTKITIAGVDAIQRPETVNFKGFAKPMTITVVYTLKNGNVYKFFEQPYSGPITASQHNNYLRILSTFTFTN